MIERRDVIERRHKDPSATGESGRVRTKLLFALLLGVLASWVFLAPPGYGPVDLFYRVIGMHRPWTVDTSGEAPTGSLFPVAHADWEQFQGGNRDGRVPDGKIARSWGDAGPKQLWSTKVHAGFGGPAIKGGEVYLIERVDDRKDVVRCLSFETGEELWRYENEVPGRLNYNGSRSTPSISETHVYATGPFGDLYCLDRKTKKLSWTHNPLKEHDGNPGRWAYSCSPVLYEHLVIIPAMGEEVGLVAFDQKTGKEAWRSPGIGGDSYASPAIHEIGGVDQVLFPSRHSRNDGMLSGMDAKTGKLLWQWEGFERGFPIPAPTAVGNGYFFLTAGYKSGSYMVRVLKKGKQFSAKEVFHVEREGAQIHPALLHKKHLYANFNNNHNLGGRRGKGNPMGLVCIGMDGKLKWKSGAEPSIGRGGLLLIGDLLVGLGGQDGKLRLIEPNPKGYKELASAEVFEGLGRRENNIWAPMAFSEGKLLVRSQNKLKCLDLREQKPQLRSQ